MSDDDLVDHLRHHAAQWWLPDRVIFIDEIPKTRTGQFDKKAIRDENPDLPIKS
jgi:fatty-acyl-CoA synthase